VSDFVHPPPRILKKDKYAVPIIRPYNSHRSHFFLESIGLHEIYLVNFLHTKTYFLLIFNPKKFIVNVSI